MRIVFFPRGIYNYHNTMIFPLELSLHTVFKIFLYEYIMHSSGYSTNSTLPISLYYL